MIYLKLFENGCRELCNCVMCLFVSSCCFPAVLLRIHMNSYEWVLQLRPDMTSIYVYGSSADQLFENYLKKLYNMLQN